MAELPLLQPAAVHLFGQKRNNWKERRAVCNTAAQSSYWLVYTEPETNRSKKEEKLQTTLLKTMWLKLQCSRFAGSTFMGQHFCSASLSPALSPPASVCLHDLVLFLSVFHSSTFYHRAIIDQSVYTCLEEVEEVVVQMLLKVLWQPNCPLLPTGDQQKTFHRKDLCLQESSTTFVDFPFVVFSLAFAA